LGPPNSSKANNTNKYEYDYI